jgi:hypothetical protein
MATQVALAIKIESQGGEKVLKNLQDLETELSALQSDLKTLDFGTAEFDAAVKSINKIKSAIKDVDKATEGLETAQRVQAISEAISIVVASFQLLSGVIGIFITESEDLEAVQRFEAKAVAILNAALGLQTILFQRAELAAKGYTLSQLANDAATKLLTFSTKVATIAQTAFNAALKANPVALVTAGIIALGAAIFGLVKIYDSFFSASAKAQELLEEENRIEQDLIKTKIEASRQLEDQVRILTDNTRTRALELKTIEDLKKSYAGFNAFLDENNNLTKEGITFLKLQIQLRQQEAALAAISQQRVAKEIEFETKAAEIRTEYGASAGILIKELRESYEDDFGAIEKVQNKYTNAVDKTLKQLTPYEKKLKDTADAEAKEAKAAENTEKAISKSAIALAKNNKALEDRLSLLELISQQIADTQAAELTFSTDVLDKQNDIIQRQNDLLGLRNTELNKSQQIIEDLSKLFFQTIPNEEDLLAANDALFDFFNFLRVGLKNNLFNFNEQIGFETLLKLFAEGTGAGEDLLKTLRDIPETTKIALNEFFNSYDQRINAIRQSFGETDIFKQLFPTEEEQKKLLAIILDVEEKQRDLFANRVNNGFTELEILEQGRTLIAERLGFDKKIISNLLEQGKLQIDIEAEKRKGKDADEQVIAGLEKQSALLVQQTTSYRNVIDIILQGVVRNNKFVESVEKGEQAFNKQATLIAKNKALIDATFDPKQLRAYFAGLGQELETIFPTIILDLQAYLERFGKDGTAAIIQGVVEGLKEQGNLTRQEAENIVNVLEKAGLALKVAFGFPFDPFAEQIKMLKELLKSLPNDLTPLQKEFSKLRDFTEDYFNILNDLSGRLSNVIAQNNANLLDQLNYEQELALSKIGEANAATQRENDRINAERLAVEKDFAKQRFELEKKARVQELQFALATAIADGAQAIINTLASIPPPLGVIAATGIGVLTGAQVQVINNQLTTARSKTFIGRRGGLIAGSDHESGGVPALLEGGEFIVNREAVARFGNTISDLNSATGGRKLAIDDSRLVQAIATQNMSSPPLKAYVVYNSITDTEKLNKKITQLARL